MLKKLLFYIFIAIGIVAATSCSTSQDVVSKGRWVKHKYTKGAHWVKSNRKKATNAPQIAQNNFPDLEEIETASPITHPAPLPQYKAEKERESLEIQDQINKKEHKISVFRQPNLSKRQRVIAEDAFQRAENQYIKAVNATDDELPEESIRVNWKRFILNVLAAIAGVICGFLLGGVIVALIYFLAWSLDEFELPRKPQVMTPAYVFNYAFVLTLKATVGLFILSGIILLLVNLGMTAGIGAVIGVIVALLILMLLLSAAMDGASDFCMPFLFIGWGR